MSDRPIQLDLLAGALGRARLRSAAVSRLELAAPFGLRMQCKARAVFFAVTDGSIRLEVAGRRPLVLSAGDLVMLLRPASYAVRDAPSSKLVAFDPYAHGPRVSVGRRRASAVVIGGWLEAEETSACRFGDGLPGVIHVAAERRMSMPELSATIDLLAAECAGDAPGARLVVARLAEILFVQALRAGLRSTDRPAQGWTHALTDPVVGRSLQHMYSAPERAWTVAMLAKLTGRSRSGFAALFKAVTGETPVEHLARYRAEVAAGLLRDGLTIEQIADRVGYSAAASFSKAFKRVTGVAPGEYRRRGAALEPA